MTVQSRDKETGPAWMRGAAAAFLGAALLIAAALPAMAAGKIVRVKTDIGVEAWLIEDHANPIISVSFVFAGGAIADPAGKEGLANFTSSMLDEGAGKLDSQAFQKQLEDLSISLSLSSGFDTIGGSLKMLTKHRDTAFNLLRLALTEPRFDPAPFDRVRTQILVGIAQRARNPNTIASEKWWTDAFPGFPYGKRLRGTPETLKAITADDMRGFAKARLGRDNLIIGVVGDIKPGELKTLIEKTFGKLPARAAKIDVSRVLPKLDGKTHVVKRPFPQSRVIFGQPGLRRDDKDWYAATVMNHVLGGGSFTSRLMKEVREKRGLAYSVGTSLNPMKYSATLMGSVGTQNSRVAQSIGLIRAEWARMRDKGATQAEMDDAVRYITGSFPLNLDSTSRIAGLLVAIQRHKLGIDYIEKRNSYIEAVTLEDVNRVARKLLQPDKLTFVVVGQPDKLE